MPIWAGLITRWAEQVLMLAEKLADEIKDEYRTVAAEEVEVPATAGGARL